MSEGKCVHCGTVLQSNKPTLRDQLNAGPVTEMDQLKEWLVEKQEDPETRYWSGLGAIRSVLDYIKSKGW